MRQTLLTARRPSYVEFLSILASLERIYGEQWDRELIKAFRKNSSWSNKMRWYKFFWLGDTNFQPGMSRENKSRVGFSAMATQITSQLYIEL